MKKGHKNAGGKYNYTAITLVPSCLPTEVRHEGGSLWLEVHSKPVAKKSPRQEHKMITQQEITDAYNRIKPFVHQTPVMTSRSLDEIAGTSVYFKCENFQKVGAFKARGAMNAVLSLSREQRARGVATHSSGNHAQALARAAKIMGTKAYIVMPRTAPQIKKQGVIAYGGKVFEC